LFAAVANLGGTKEEDSMLHESSLNAALEAQFAIEFDLIELLASTKGTLFLLVDAADDALSMKHMAALQFQGRLALETNTAHVVEFLVHNLL
jgi:hypothetical protein